MENCTSGSDSSSNLLEHLPPSETSLCCTPPCISIRAVPLPFVWRVLSTVGTLSFTVYSARRAPAWGNRGPGLHSRSPGWELRPEVPQAAAGFAPGKHVHFGSLACPPTPGASPRSRPFLCNRPDTPHIPLCCTVRARQPLCPSCALGDGEAFCRVERDKGRARQQQPPRGRSVAVLAVLLVGLGSLQRAQGGGSCPGPESGGASGVECPPLL